MPPTKQLLIILEGNISAGKSTLARELGARLHCKVYMEPTLANPYLERFYAEPAKWGLKMQLWLLRQRFYTMVFALRHMLTTDEGVILDRSVFSDTVFADKGHFDGIISSEEYRCYNLLRSQMLKQVPWPHVLLYLDVSPQTCLARIASRGRGCESGIPLDYLSGLDDFYHQFTHNMAAKSNGKCAVVRQEWNNFGLTEDVADRILEAVGDAPGFWEERDVELYRELVASPSRVRAAVTFEVPVEWDSDPLPEPIDPDVEARLQDAVDMALAPSPERSPATRTEDAREGKATSLFPESPMVLA